MSKSELLNKLEELEQVEDKTENINYQILKIINDLTKEKLSKEEKHKLGLLSINAQVEILSLKLETLPSKEYESIINYRGKLINLLKEKEKFATNKKDMLQARYLVLEELKKHKCVLKKYKADKNVKIPITRKLGLTIQDISKSMEIFMREKDVVVKAGNTIRQSALGIAGASAITLATTLIFCKVTGQPLTLSMLAKVAPATAYIGLSSLVRNITNKTEFEMYQYMNSDEYKYLVKSFNDKHEKEFKEIGNIIDQKKSTTDRKQLLEINENLIQKYNDLIIETDIQGIIDTFNLQILDLLRENKDICESFKDDYEEERNDDKEFYKSNNKKLMKINIEIFKLGNSIKDALINAKDNIIKSVKVIVISKAILAAIAPSTFAVGGLKSLSTPILIAAINSLIDIPTYPNKLKFRQTAYTGKVKMKDKKRIEEIVGSSNYARAFA